MDFADASPGTTQGTTETQDTSQTNENPTQSGTHSSPSNSTAHETPQTTKEMTQEFEEIVVNGKTERLTREQLRDRARLASAAHQKFEEAAKTRKEVDRIISAAKSNPIQALMDPALGLTPDQVRDAFEKWYYEQYVEPESLTPEQRKIKEYEKELQTYKQQEKEAKEKAEQESRSQQEEEVYNKEKEHLHNKILEAMNQAGAPKGPAGVKFMSRVAYHMRLANKQGWDAPIDYIVRQVQAEKSGEIQDHCANLEGQALIDALGKNITTKIINYYRETLRQKRDTNNPPFSPTKPKNQYNPDEKIDYDEVKRRMRNYG